MYAVDIKENKATPQTPWALTAQAKRDDIRNRIPQEWHLKEALPDPETTRDFTGEFIALTLSDREVEITESDPVDIVEKTTSGQWTAYEVTKAFCHRAALAHQLVNCLHEVFFDAALEEAERQDTYFKQNKRPIGPLHGLPVSLKDQFHVRGVDTSMGYVGWIGTFEGKRGDQRYRTLESELVKELRSLGAILYCKTSCAVTLMCPETVNNIIGYTANPRNRLLSAGGSSGGEGALQCLRGSPCGFGTDIGGSVRIPAAFCGIYSLRTSAGRLPYEGVANSFDGQNTLLSVVGPMATTAGGLKLLMKAVLSKKPWLGDPLTPPIPWRIDLEEEIKAKAKHGDGKRLAFGILWDDGIVRPQPPVRRALHLVADILKKLDHGVIDWKPPSHRMAHKLAVAAYYLDAANDLKAQMALSNEPTPKPLNSVLNRTAPEKTASEIFSTNREKREYQKKYLDYWNSTASLTGTDEPVDAFIAPVSPFAAARHGGNTYVGYSIAINTLDYSSVVIPVTQANRLLDGLDDDPEYTPLSEEDKAVHDDYDPDIYHGAFVGLQVVGRRYDEEKLIALAEFLTEEINQTHAGPATNSGMAIEPQLESLKV